MLQSLLKTSLHVSCAKCKFFNAVTNFILFLGSIKQEFRVVNFTNYNREEYTFHINEKVYLSKFFWIMFFCEIVVSTHSGQCVIFILLENVRKLGQSSFSIPPDIVRNLEVFRRYRARGMAWNTLMNKDFAISLKDPAFVILSEIKGRTCYTKFKQNSF